MLTLACGSPLGPTTSETSTGGETTGTSVGASTTPESSSTTGVDPTTGETSLTSSSSSSSSGSQFCMFDEDAPEPFLNVNVLQNKPLVDGAIWPIECGGQGLWMFGLYPDFGGWTPMWPSVAFKITVDVEGFNTNPLGHFFNGPVTYYIGCEGVIGGVTGVLPVLPPDDLVDLAALDGLPATVHVEIDVKGQTLTVDAVATLSAPKALIDMGCGFGP